MYEIFMTAFVEDADFNAACSVLGGLCSMQPWGTINRVLYFQGPSRPVGLSNQASIEKPIRKNVAPLWKELHQSLSRQSFVLQARYEVQKERDLGPAAAPMELDTMAGILRFTDFPDPPHGKPLLTQRKMVELWEQRAIPSILRDNQYKFKGETVDEIYRFFRDDIELCLTKQHIFKNIQEYSTIESRSAAEFSPAQQLPAWESLTPMDKQNRWILQVKTHVLQDNKPDEIRKAQEQLHSIRNELDGVVAFKVIDRKVHDTRVALPQQGVQALPQKVTIGK